MPEPKQDAVQTHLKQTFAAGLLALVPAMVTLWVLYTVFNFADRMLGDWFTGAIGFRIPGLGLIVTVLLVYAIGLFAQRMGGRRLLAVWESFATRLPLVGGIYKVTKEVSLAIGARDKRAFQQVVLVEFPGKGMWSFGFLTGEVPRGSGMTPGAVYVFIPTTPNPTNGFLVLVPTDQVRPTTYTVDEGMRIIISGGIVDPRRLADEPTPEGDVSGAAPAST